MSHKLQDFIAKWMEDHANSDSIEPMLKGMGVSWKIRKIVPMLKIIQQIDVLDNELIIKNITKNKTDSTVHVINGGERRIETSHGEYVVDNCKFNPDSEFPLKIEAILPNNKGRTIDRRKLIENGSRFLQHLTYKFPEPTDGNERPEDLHMMRIFIRLEEPGESSGTEFQDEKSMSETPISIGNDDSPLSSSLPHSSMINGEKVDRINDNHSLELWVVCLFMIMYATVLFPLKKSFAHHIAFVVIGAVFAVSRSLSRTESGTIVAISQRWNLFMLSLFGCAFAVIFCKNCFLVQLVAGLFAAVTRVHTGPVMGGLLNGNEWSFIGGLILASGLVFTVSRSFFSYLLSTTLFIGGVMIGYEMIFTRTKTQNPKPQNDGIKDKDCENLTVSVTDYRVVEKLYSQYKVQVTYKGLAWHVWRRYSQFDSLRHELRRVFGGGVLPQLPVKTWFTSLDEEFLEERTLQLDTFINYIFQSELCEKVFQVAETKNFLGVVQGRGVPASLIKPKINPISLASPEETEEFCVALKRGKQELEKALSVGEGDGWKFQKHHQGAQCYTKEEDGLMYTKTVGMCSYSPEVLAAFLEDHKSYLFDDVSFKDTPLKKINPTVLGSTLGCKHVDLSSCSHVEFMSPFPLIIAPRDIVAVTCRMFLPDRAIIILIVSVSDKYCKPISKCIRANVICGGFEIKPNSVKEGTSIFTTVQMVNLKGSIPRWIVKAAAADRASLFAKIEKAIKSLPTPPAPLVNSVY